MNEMMDEWDGEMDPERSDHEVTWIVKVCWATRTEKSAGTYKRL